MAATFAVTVAPDENLIFVPSVVNASVGDTILWTWGSDFHTGTSLSFSLEFSFGVKPPFLFSSCSLFQSPRFLKDAKFLLAVSILESKTPEVSILLPLPPFFRKRSLTPLSFLDTFNITVTEPGVISYVCQPHCLLGMQASINVN